MRTVESETSAKNLMPEAPLVDVVMPVYNGERFVSLAVESILRQTLTRLRLIAVDDASQDATPEILESWTHRDPRLHVHRLANNSGVIGARNAGLGIATAPFVAVMDADDISLPQRLERQVTFLERHPSIGVVGSFVELIDDEGRVTGTKTYPTSPAMASWSLFFFNTLAHPTVMARRELLAGLSGYSPEAKGGTEDFDLLARASIRSGLANIPEPLVRYRKWAGSMTQSQFERQESFADLVVQRHVKVSAGVDVTTERAAALRGLSAGRYPSGFDEIRALDGLVVTLRDGFLESRELDPSGRSEVARDAAARRMLLAALALRVRPLAGAWMFVQTAMRTPTGLLEFGKRVARNLSARRAK